MSNKYKFLLAFIVVLIVVFHFKIEDLILRYKGTCIKGIVIEIKPFRSGKKDTYLYEFSYDGKKYTGDTWLTDQSKVGIEIQVVFLTFYPSINRSIDGYFDGDFNCSEK